LIISLNKII